MGLLDAAKEAAKELNKQKKAEEARKKVEEQERSAASRVEIWFMENVPFAYDVIMPAINCYGSSYNLSEADREMIADLKRYTYEVGGDAVINVRINKLAVPGWTNNTIGYVCEGYGVVVKKR